MARVSQAHLDARRRQILDAAWRCFLRDGFHATSMQDVIAEAGLSAGAIYRYFPSKDDIIAATAAEAQAALAGTFAVALAADPLPPLDEVLGRVLATIEELERSRGMGRIVIQAWGEALRTPALAAHGSAIFREIGGALIDLVATYQRRGLLSAAAPAEQIARVLIAVLHGFLIQHLVLGEVDAATFRAGLRALLGDSRGAGAAGP